MKKINIFLIVFIFFIISACTSFAQGISNFLMYPDDDVNYVQNSLPGWGVSHPGIGTPISAPVEYGAIGERRAGHEQLLGNYGTNSNPTNSLIVYSRFTAVNTTNEFFIVHGDDSTSAWVYRNSTNVPINGGAPLRMKPSLGQSSRALGEVNELRWDYSGDHPYRLYFVGYNIPNSQSVNGENVSTSFYYLDIDPVTGLQSDPVLIHDFSNEFPLTGVYPTGGYDSALIFNDVEGDSSIDSRYWVWQVRGPYEYPSYDLSAKINRRYAVFMYDKSTDQIIGRVQRDCTGVLGLCTTANTLHEDFPYISAPNMTESSPLGTKAIIDWGRASSIPCTLSGSWVNVSGNIWSYTGYKSKTSGNSVFGKFTVNDQRVTKVGSGTSGSASSISAENQYAVNSASDTIYLWVSGDADPNTKTIIADWGARIDDLGSYADGPKACNRDFTSCFRIGNSEEHSGWAWSQGGAELFVYQNNGNDYVEATDITSSVTAACSLIGSSLINKMTCGTKIAKLYPDFSKSGDLSYPVGVHFGKFYDQNKKGWVLMDTSGKALDTWFSNQILMLEVKPYNEVPAPKIWRISPGFNLYYTSNYRTEGSGALNFDAMEIWITANYGLPSVENQNEVYSIKLPSNWYETLNHTDTDIVATSAPNNLQVF